MDSRVRGNDDCRIYQSSLNSSIQRSMIWNILWLGVLCCTWTVSADSGPLPAFEAEYRVYRNSIGIGKSRVSLAPSANGEFLYESITKASGILAWFHKNTIREYSRWVYHDDKIRPLEYRYENSGKGDERTEHMTFDWVGGMVQQTNRKPTWKIDLPDGTLDKVTMTLALMLDLKQKHEDVTYAIADDGKFRYYRFHIVGRESVSTPAGKFDTLKLERIRDNKRRSTTLWCAPELNYLPVKMEQREDNGTVYRSLLKKFSPKLRLPQGNI